MKRIGTSLLCLVLLLSLLPVSVPVSADEERYTDGAYTYTVSNGNATIIKCESREKELVIPDKLGGYSVVAIGDKAFDTGFEKPYTSITIPEGIISIGSYAFDN